MKQDKQHIIIRRWLLLFIVVLFLSGLSVLPAEWELTLALSLLPKDTIVYNWLSKVLTGYKEVHANNGFLLYGYDWLAFAHFVLAILFIGTYRDPVKNVWVIQFGLIASILIIPFAFIAGFLRSIPFWWQLVDSSFGVFGFILLWLCLKKIRQLPNTS